MAAVRAFMDRERPGPRDVVMIGCDRGAGIGVNASRPGVRVWPITCVGNLHSSVVELLIRAGAGGVMVVACPPRDCWNREGPKWTEQRLFHDREAELQARVDRRRVRLVFAAVGDRDLLAAALGEFQAAIAALVAQGAEAEIDVSRECETSPVRS